MPLNIAVNMTTDEAYLLAHLARSMSQQLMTIGDQPSPSLNHLAERLIAQARQADAEWTLRVAMFAPQQAIVVTEGDLEMLGLKSPAQSPSKGA